MTASCADCGREMQIGEYPFCPHGFPAANRKAQEVTWPGGKTFENGFSEPRTFYSPAEYHRALGELGLKVRGDGEESGAWISQASLEKAKALVMRCTS